MRIWDVHPGYLNRQSLLGEHRELHGIVAIVAGNRRGYAAHPETRRWAPHPGALAQRHRLLAAEMALRGYCDRSPVTAEGPLLWPDHYIDEPAAQFALLAAKYADRAEGRLPLPRSSQQLWAQHKYSVMARDYALYRELGQQVTALPPCALDPALARQLVEILRLPPPAGALRNALQHMWGYVADSAAGPAVDPATAAPAALLGVIQQRACAAEQPYLLASTALSELMAWLPAEPAAT